MTNGGQQDSLGLLPHVFGEITRWDPRKSCEKLVKNFTKRPKQSSNMPAPMKHGLQESAAVRKCEQYIANIRHKVHVFESGILVRPDLPFLGCTPDRKVIDPNFHPRYGLLEIELSLHSQEYHIHEDCKIRFHFLPRH